MVVLVLLCHAISPLKTGDLNDKFGTTIRAPYWKDGCEKNQTKCLWINQIQKSASFKMSAIWSFVRTVASDVINTHKGNALRRYPHRWYPWGFLWRHFKQDDNWLDSYFIIACQRGEEERLRSFDEITKTIVKSIYWFILCLCNSSLSCFKDKALYK